MVNSADFSKRIQRIMEVYDLNASSFAERIDVGRASISHILSGRNKPSLEFVMKVVKEFTDVELYWLLNGKGNFPSTSTQQEAEKDKSSTTTPSQSATVQNHESESSAFSNQVANKDQMIKKVIICYNDGTFDAFEPSNL
ncbi:helix-turn-helix domain-containing protein [Psychroflexus sp. ALD_RP9]|uniref:helix-turn-helix domain-containing protein n=1 Tax=Psychroflexus sp. ALD_RP9 TaxID=2777186 RepID=UPI001A8EA9DE|nr:helix-turn-helix transcriptional regulator [Psychroflexus sp. ALD_RP9]QSS97021.1 helix-turn-helix transcriptional regulator [Psychroflexus sp. ALD_RP9]